MFRVGDNGPKWLGDIESTDPQDPRPFILPGVRMQFAHISPGAMRAARKAAGALLTSEPENIEDAGDELTRELLRRGILAWEGIGPLEGDELLPVTAETKEWVIANPDLFNAADRAYVLPYFRRREEGNVSAASPSGTGAGEMPAKDTATSTATRKPKAGASRMSKPVKKAARTSSTSPNQKKAGGSGKS